MMTRVNQTVIQAFPLNKNTKIVNVGDVFSPSKDKIEVIHANEDSRIKATFNDGTYQEFDMTSKMDMSLGDDILSIECLSGSILAG